MNRLNRAVKVLLLLLALLLLAGVACAEELEEGTLELKLFQNGDFPEMRMVQTYSTDGLAEYIREQMLLQTAEIWIDSYQVTLEELSVVLTDVINDHPDLFFVNHKVSYAKYSGSDIVAYVKPTYMYTGDDLTARIASFNSTVSSIASYASHATTTVGKVLRINDYFCTNFSYVTGETKFYPDQLFSTGSGVCQAYMLGYAAVLDELGISNTYASSEAMNHTWNVVNVDGSWYHIDVTWNDPLSDYAMRAKHNNFLLSDSGIEATGHYSWTSAAAGGNTKYDGFFWTDLSVPLGAVGNAIYYVSDPSQTTGERTLYRWTASSGSEALKNFSIVTPEGRFSYYSGYAPVAANSSRVYYAVNGSLVAAHHDGSDPELIYTTSDGRHIYSCILSGSTMRMLVGSSPYEADVVTCSVNDGVALSLEPSVLALNPGETAQLTAALSVEPEIDLAYFWESEDDLIAAVDETGLVTAVAPGTVTVTCTYTEGAAGACTVFVLGGEAMVLPEDTQVIEAEAFAGIAAGHVVLPDGVTAIGARAFADCPDLTVVSVPAGVTDIAGDAFENSPNAVVVYRKSSAEPVEAE